jgi:hypothetical protein
VKINNPSAELEIKVKVDTVDDWVATPMRFIPSRCIIVDKYLKMPLFVPFLVDRKHPANRVVACVHRFGCEMPKIQKQIGRDFKLYSLAFLKRWFTPADAKCSLELWLQESSYKPGRKKCIRLERANLELSDKSLTEVLAFIKDELYPEPKNARAINGHSLAAMSLLAGIVKAVDHATFHGEHTEKWFVKGTDPKSWPAKLASIFQDSPVMATDFSSFEAHHRGVCADVVAAWFNHMTSKMNVTYDQMALLYRLQSGINKSEFGTMSATIPQRLMSGALWTSSSNGVLNLLIMSYLNLRTKMPNCPAHLLPEFVEKYFTGVCEGDDGVCVDNAVDQWLINALGLKLKFERHHHISEASFCGIVCDPATLQCVRDPLKFLMQFSILPVRYRDAKPAVHLALLRAKALSYLYQCRTCPIIGPFCRRVCKITQHVLPRFDKDVISYTMQEYAAKAVEEKAWLPVVIPMSLRQLVVEHWGVPVAHQLRLEQDINNATDVFLLDLREYTTQDQLTMADFIVTKGQRFWHPTPTANGMEEISRTGLRALHKDLQLERAAKAFKKPKGAIMPSTSAFAVEHTT